MKQKELTKTFMMISNFSALGVLTALFKILRGNVLVIINRAQSVKWKLTAWQPRPLNISQHVCNSRYIFHTFTSIFHVYIYIYILYNYMIIMYYAILGFMLRVFF